MIIAKLKIKKVYYKVITKYRVLQYTIYTLTISPMLLDSFSQHNSAPKLKEKGKAKQETLDKIPLDIQEAMILEDLLYVLLVSPSGTLFHLMVVNFLKGN